ncbi:membrane hypothetical protein [Gammaproteobacteria bacterium]
MISSIKGRSVVSLLAINLCNQLVGLALQVFIARQFGASVDMDAYLAGLAIPQYIILILNTGISASLLPAYYEKSHVERDAFLTNLTVTLAFLCLPIAIFGFFFAPLVFRLFFSELPAATIATGTVICRYGFFAVVTGVLINVLGSIHFIHRKFSYQAIVPTLGQVANLLLVFCLSRYGIYSLLMAFLGSQLLQVALLSSILPRLNTRPSFRLIISPTARSFLVVIMPMILSTVVIKSTGVWERYLAGMAANKSAGTISHVDYASKIITALAAISISALPTLIYPSISAAIARKDHGEFIKIVNDGLFFTFFITAPILSIGYFISLDVVQVLLQRGHFTADDSVEVAAVLQVYLFSIVFRGLGGITGNALYALKLVKWVSIVGVIETFCYLGYSYLLTKRFGVIGIPLGVTVSFIISVVWALVLIRQKTKTSEARILSNYTDYLKVIVISWLTAIVASLVRHYSVGGVEGVSATILAGGAVYIALSYCARIVMVRKMATQVKIILSRIGLHPTQP